MQVQAFYALLPDERRVAVFEDVSDNVRKVIVATNVAEISVTIPGAAYVLDTGRAKEKVHRGAGGGLLSAFDVQYISKASAIQRAGCAGRTGPGHCYRLYSPAVFDQKLREFRAAEVLRVPADALVLRPHALGIRHVVKFPFRTRPDSAALKEAEALLALLGAIDEANPHALLGAASLGRELA